MDGLIADLGRGLVGCRLVAHRSAGALCESIPSEALTHET